MTRAIFMRICLTSVEENLQMVRIFHGYNFLFDKLLVAALRHDIRITEKKITGDSLAYNILAHLEHEKHGCLQTCKFKS